MYNQMEKIMTPPLHAPNRKGKVAYPKKKYRLVPKSEMDRIKGYSPDYLDDAVIAPERLDEFIKMWK